MTWNFLGVFTTVNYTLKEQEHDVISKSTYFSLKVSIYKIIPKTLDLLGLDELLWNINPILVGLLPTLQMKVRDY